MCAYRVVFKVENDEDDDHIGFVFGFKSPRDTFNNEDPNYYNFLLFNWKQRDQNIAREGKMLAYVNGEFTPAETAFYFRQDSSNSRYQVIDTVFGDSTGWVRDSAHNFTLVYTPTRTTILIDGDTIFNKVGCFHPGRFGFYNSSQEKVNYSNFSYSLETNFEVARPDICLGDTAQFLFTGKCFTPEEATVNLVSWEWDLGDGSTSIDLNPKHAYKDTGSYEVTLIVEDKMGCRDTVVKYIHVFPPISADATIEDATCFGTANGAIHVTTTGGNGDYHFQWREPIYGCFWR